MNLFDLNHLVCEWLKLEKKKCVGVTNEVLREKGERKKEKTKRKRKKESSVECSGVWRKW